MPEPLQRVPVAPGNHADTYAPTSLRSHAEEALDRLFEMKPDDARLAILHTVDPILLGDLSNLLLSIGFVSKRAGNAANTLRELVIEQRLTTTRRRALVATLPRPKKEPNEVTREVGEEKQLAAEELPSVVARMTDREKERRFHARKLWDLCAVRFQVEMHAFPESADLAEFKLLEMMDARTKRKYFDDRLGLREGITELQNGSTVETHGFDQVPIHMSSIGRDFASSGIFGAVGSSSSPIAVSWVHEIRFYGHGKAGTEGRSASFKFADSETFTSGLRDPHRIMRFRAMRNVMAPGASILLEGCETGRGAAGKSFLGALGELFFGSEKWGFVRASTGEITFTANIWEGPIPVDPITLKWPDDF
jgi:hypothetical protein